MPEDKSHIFNVNLLGKRYPELNEALSVSLTSLISIYTPGQPENQHVTFANFQKSVTLKGVSDFQSESLLEKKFVAWSPGDDRFKFFSIVSDDLPNLDAGKITSGIFDIERIPEIPVSKINQAELETFVNNLIDNSQSIVIPLGSVVSSSLELTGNTDRIVGLDDLAIEINETFLDNLYVRNERTLTIIGQGLLVNNLGQVTVDLSQDREITLTVDSESVGGGNSFGFIVVEEFLYVTGAQTFLLEYVPVEVYAVYLQGVLLRGNTWEQGLSNQVTIDSEFVELDENAQITIMYRYTSEMQPEIPMPDPI